ncbi:DUF4956 domain-containing protein [Natronoglycomyces albus]|uniref:DUF4956 domain-containing protein n=1 Tax=Natronoglycomyces albus TaxID=2811108 RepID=A0A895XN30_9ACTN|nr:DUF4956 domain-containing protein [Natronoglycomyces albus]QSB05182.1 DUF4956 domain-containing protein [Natronoglycomyces albus]
MDILLALALPINLFSIAVLAYAIYFRRHRRADLMFAYIALNVGVFTVSAIMLTQNINLGVAFGLFGVLAIIRLRSDSISQREIGYYFIAIALGLVNGIGSSFPVAMILLNLLLLTVMFVADHALVSGGVERRVLVLDFIINEKEGLRADLEQRLDAEVLRLEVDRVDYVRDTMSVDVRYRPRPPHATYAASANNTATTVQLPAIL